MQFNLSVIDWNSISAIATTIGVLVALFYQPFANRKRLLISTGIITKMPGYIHELSIRVINIGLNPVYIVSCGIVFNLENKKCVQFIENSDFPKKLESSENMQIENVNLNGLHRNITNIYFQDGTGKFWYLKGKNKKDLLSNLLICEKVQFQLLKTLP